jgi:outer membrane receptor protein involved in Fe transport
LKRTRTVSFILVAITSLARPALGQEPPAAGAAPPVAATPALSSITGVAVDTADKKPVADVVVTLSSALLPGGEQIAVTDAKGVYTFKNLPPGRYQMRFDGSAIKPLAKDITVEGGKRFTANVELLPESLVAEEIIVTGTRIPRLEVDTAAPVTTVTRAQIQSSGRVSAGDIIQTLPEQTGGINTQVNNGGDGSTRVNLRGFGTNRTLVLLNGRRMVPGGTGTSSTVDLNTIPTAAIERIEILKDGASAIYGSDAVSGVVNIITRTDYDAVELSGFTGISQRGDGRIYDISFTIGKSAQRGSILFSAGYTSQTEVWARHRDFSYFDYGVAGYDWVSAQKRPGGSSSIPNGRFAKPADMGNAAWEALKAQYPNATNFTIGDDGQWRPFNGSGVTEAGGDFYNYQPENYLVTPQQRLNLFSTGSYRLLGSLRAYYEALYTHRESEQKLAPEPLLTDGEGLIVSRDNVYNPWGVDFATVRRRLVEFDNRTYTQDVDTFRVVTGVKGNFLPSWSWDVSVNYGRTQGVAMKDGLLQRSKLANALGPSFIDPNDGVAKCGTPAAPIDGCVPVNLFGPAGSISPEARDALTYRGTARAYKQQVVVAAATAGEIVKIGNAVTPMGFAGGYEHRSESAASIQDPLTSQGDTTGNKIANTEGSYYVNEAFLELNAPILGRFGSWAGAGNLLEVNGAGRFVSYSSFGNAFTYKAGARVSPTRDFTLRGTFSTAFRAPSVGELYLGAADAFPNATDPCSNRTQNTPLDAACDAQGVPDLVDDRSQLRARIGGNDTLEPETAQSFTIGAVMQPRWVKDLELTVDYYNTKVTNAIQPVTADVILASCFPAQGGTATYCDRIHRAQSDGLISSIDDPLSNVGGDHISGIDFQIDYSPRTPVGDVGVTFNLNYLGFFDRTLASGRVINAKGTYDLSLVLPEWRGNVTLGYGNSGWSGALTVRWLDSFRECKDNACQQTDPSAPPPRTRKIDAYAVADLNVGYKLSHTGGSATFYAVGVNNLFDATPPYIVNGFTAASDNSAYDYMGRYFYVRLSHEFK